MWSFLTWALLTASKVNPKTVATLLYASGITSARHCHLLANDYITRKLQTALVLQAGVTFTCSLLLLSCHSEIGLTLPTCPAAPGRRELHPRVCLRRRGMSVRGRSEWRRCAAWNTAWRRRRKTTVEPNRSRRWEASRSRNTQRRLVWTCKEMSFSVSKTDTFRLIFRGETLIFKI